MSSKYETKENREASLEISIETTEFQKALMASYHKNMRYFQVPGFRKGKAPYPVVINYYGESVLYDDALEAAVPDAYEAALKEHDIKAYSEPRINISTVSGKEGVVFTADFALKPEVKLGTYKGVTAFRPDVEVSDSEIEAKIEEARKSVAREIAVTDRPVKDGDTVTIDYVGKKDGEAFAGGSAENHELKIGSHSFIAGFEEGLIGKELGSHVELELTFPKEYHAKELAGKDVVFEVDIKEIKETQLPLVDDDFVKDVSETANNVAEYREEIRKEIAKDKEEQADRVFEQHILSEILEHSEIVLSQYIIEDEVNHDIENQKRQFAMYGMKYEDFLKYSGKTLEQVKKEMLPATEQKVRFAYLLDAIEEKEAPEATEAEIESKIADYAKQSNLKVEEFKEKYLKDEFAMSQIEHEIKSEKVLTMLRNESKVTHEDPHHHDHEDAAAQSGKAKADKAAKSEKKTTKAKTVKKASTAEVADGEKPAKAKTAKKKQTTAAAATEKAAAGENAAGEKTKEGK